MLEDTKRDPPGWTDTTFRNRGERIPQSEGNWREKERIRVSRGVGLGVEVRRARQVSKGSGGGEERREREVCQM